MPALLQDSEKCATLDLSGRQDAADELFQVADSPEYKRHLRSVNLEFTAGVKDEHLQALRGCHLQNLNLNGCQQ